MGSYSGWRNSWSNGSWSGQQWSEQDWSSWAPPVAPTVWELVHKDDAAGLRARLSDVAGVREIVNQLNSKGWSPLQVAAICNAAAAAEVLLEHGADISAKSGYLSPTALHLASWHGNLEVGRVLLTHGADTRTLNGIGEFPIEKASQRGQAEMEALLLSFGSPSPAPARRVENNHAVTALACAAARAAESDRPDALFFDPLAHRLACEEGRPYGGGMSWILTPRTYVGDVALQESYERGTRQVVLIGAGMDARAYRMGLDQMHYFEVDQATIFDVKEPLLEGVPLQCAGRHVVVADFSDPKWDLVEALREQGFDSSRPSFWLLEGLVMYLQPNDVNTLFAQMNELSAPGSGVVHDAVSATSQSLGIQCCGAKFMSGNDDYAGLWHSHGFNQVEVVNFSAVWVDREQRTVHIDRSRSAAPPAWVTGKQATFFVRAEKTA